MWSIKECKDCYYLKENKCWYKNHPIPIPEDICTELKLQGEDDS
jgi:hypothetical protein